MKPLEDARLAYNTHKIIRRIKSKFKTPGEPIGDRISGNGDGHCLICGQESHNWYTAYKTVRYVEEENTILYREARVKITNAMPVCDKHADLLSSEIDELIKKSGGRFTEGEYSADL